MMNHFYIDQSETGGWMLATDIGRKKHRIFLRTDSVDDEQTLELLKLWLREVHPLLDLQVELEGFIEWAGNEPDDQPYGDDVPAAVRAYLEHRSSTLTGRLHR